MGLYPTFKMMSAQHLSNNGCLSKSDLKDKQLSVLRKCRSKVDCLIFEMLFIKELKPGLNAQKDCVLNCLHDTACKCFLAFNSALFYSLWICSLYIYIQINNLFFLIHFDLKMMLSKR